MEAAIDSQVQISDECRVDIKKAVNIHPTDDDDDVSVNKVKKINRRHKQTFTQNDNLDKQSIQLVRNSSTFYLYMGLLLFGGIFVSLIFIYYFNIFKKSKSSIANQKPFMKSLKKKKVN